jgi:hypothetical protein
MTLPKILLPILILVSPLLAQNANGNLNKSGSRLVGKGTPADLSRHHSDTSSIVLHNNGRNSTASDLAKIEQQSIHAPTASGMGTGRAKAMPMAKLSVQKNERNTPINFANHAAPRRQMAAVPSNANSTNKPPHK